MLKQQTKQYEVLLVPGALWLTWLFFKINWNWKPSLWVSNTQVNPTQAHYKLYNKVTNTSVGGSTIQPMNYTEHRSTGMKRLLMPPPPPFPHYWTIAGAIQWPVAWTWSRMMPLDLAIDPYKYKFCDLHWSGGLLNSVTMELIQCTSKSTGKHTVYLHIYTLQQKY